MCATPPLAGLFCVDRPVSWGGVLWQPPRSQNKSPWTASFAPNALPTSHCRVPVVGFRVSDIEASPCSESPRGRTEVVALLVLGLAFRVRPSRFHVCLSPARDP